MRGVEPLQSGLRNSTPHRRTPTPELAYQQSERLAMAAYAQEISLNNESMEQFSNNNNITIYLVFWPQLLEFVGFALLFVPFLSIIFHKRDFMKTSE